MINSQEADLVSDIGNCENVSIKEDCSELNKENCIGTDNDKELIFNSLTTGTMEIEQILDAKVKQEETTRIAVSIGESLIHGKMEIERVLDEIVTNQSNGETLSSHTSPDVSQSPTKSIIANGRKSSANENVSFPQTMSTSPAMGMGIGARPKDPASIKKNRPSSLHGLSKVNIDSQTSMKSSDMNGTQDMIPSNTANKMFAINSIDSQTSFDGGVQKNLPFSPTSQNEFLPPPSTMDRQRLYAMEITSSSAEQSHTSDIPEGFGSNLHGAADDPHAAAGDLEVNDSVSAASRMKRPTTLNLPARPEFSLSSGGEEEGEISDCYLSLLVSFLNIQFLFKIILNEAALGSY